MHLGDWRTWLLWFLQVFCVPALVVYYRYFRVTFSAPAASRFFHDTVWNCFRVCGERNILVILGCNCSCLSGGYIIVSLAFFFAPSVALFYRVFNSRLLRFRLWLIHSLIIFVQFVFFFCCSIPFSHMLVKPYMKYMERNLIIYVNLTILFYFFIKWQRYMNWDFPEEF